MNGDPSPPRKALLIGAGDLKGRLKGRMVKEGAYIVTPDMAAYEAIYTRYVVEHRTHGTAMPYADERRP